MIKIRVLLCILLWGLFQFAFGVDRRGDTIEINRYRLYLDFRDFDTHILHGSANIAIRAKQNDVRQINLDLLRLKVDSVKVNGLTGLFNYDDSLLHIGFLKALRQGDSALLTVYYHGKPSVLPGDFGGFYWDNRYAFNIGVSFESDPHNYGRVWFPCFDNFEVRSYYEYFITTRNWEKAFCNGTLMDVKTDSTSTVWHWKLNETIPSYLASVAVAAYQTVKDTVNGINGATPIEIAVLPEDTAGLKKYFNHLHQAFHILEHYWGPYRWERVGYCIVPFKEGAMEHATNIAFMQYYLNAYFKECETTMVHEMSHHWFGDLVTCDNAQEMWLNEAWASYSQSLFVEGFYGPDSARMFRRANHLNEVMQTHVGDKGYLPVSGVPSKDAFSNTVYQKGADVINTLRYYLGDSVFFNCMRSYLNEYAFETASTRQLHDYLAACSGKNLDDFFDDWITAPGYTHFSIRDKYIKRVKGKYEVSINIRQRLDHAPKLYNGVPLTVSYFDNNMKRVDEKIWVSGECNTYSTNLNFKPAFIALDVDGNLAQAITSEQQVLHDTGVYFFNNALVMVQVESIKDSSLMRIEQNLVAADEIANPVKGLHLNNIRYWTVDGVFNPSLKATGIFEYSAVPGDEDEDFITNEDSLVMMYRPNQQSQWEKVNSFFVDKGEDDSDNVGAIMVSPLRKGEYAMGVYNSRLPTATLPAQRCPSISKERKAGVDFKLHCEGDEKLWVIDFGKNIFERAEICDMTGKKLWDSKIDQKESRITSGRGYTAAATYIVILTTKTGKRIIKKLTNK